MNVEKTMEQKPGYNHVRLGPFFLVLFFGFCLFVFSVFFSVFVFVAADD